MSYWKNKVVLITGASSGIGKELSRNLSRKGARLAIVARREEALNELIEELGPNPVVPIVADVRDAKAMVSVAETVTRELGPIEVLIANAGIGSTTRAPDLDVEAVANVIDTNVMGVVNSIAAVLPGLVSRRAGQLVAISSLAAYRGLPASAAYCASKAGLSSFMESVRLDLRNTGVDVTIIHPGFIKTPLTEGRQANMPYLMELDEAVEKIVTAIEERKKSYAFPWQLASIVRLAMIMPNFMYDWIASRNSFRE